MPRSFEPKLGRLPRVHNPAVPKLANLIAALPTAPATANNLARIPASVGMMMNDTLGCCVSSAVYHAIQVWSGDTGSEMQTNPDTDVLTVYEKCCGYNPASPATDQGCVEQTVLLDWLRKGVPLGAGIRSNKLLGFVEVDVTDLNAIKWTVDEFGVCFIGFQVPQNIMPPDDDPPMVWTVDPSNPPIIGGHAVVLGKYDDNAAGLISWGSSLYEMDWSFFQKYVDEAYALVDHDWMLNSGKTPAGMTLPQLEALLKQL